MRLIATAAALLVLIAAVSANVMKERSRSRRDIALIRIRRDPLYGDHQKNERIEELLNQYGYDDSDYSPSDDNEPINKLPAIKKPGVEDAVDDGPNVNVTEMYLKDPCVSIRCSGGAMCVIKDLEKSITACECPKACPFMYKPVCSVMGVQYDSKCHLHMQACQKRRYIKIAYESACIPKSQKCTKSELEQFPSRFLDWALMVRDEEYLGEAKLNRNVAALPKITQKHVAQWIFTKFDSNENQHLDRAEQMEIKLLIKSVEKCVGKFIANCDINKDRKITGKEWVQCLLPGTSMDTKYFDKLYTKFTAEKVATKEELKELPPPKEDAPTEEEHEEEDED